MGIRIPRTAEHVGDGHPDKFCDQVADALLDRTLELCSEEFLPSVRLAIECLAKDNMLIVTGEVKWTDAIKLGVNVQEIARDVWRKIGYSDCGKELTVVDHIQSQSAHIALGTDTGGAGDQGVMVGYATDETPEMMPKEYVLARDLCTRLGELRNSKAIPWLRADTKAQVTIDADGNPTDYIVASQHDDPEKCGVSHDEMRKQIFEQVVQPVLGEGIDFRPNKINGTGLFVIGGPTGDAGVVGRKIVVDQFGPRVPVGGGAFSGKDPSKVDRSAAYMARYIAKNIVAAKLARVCEVQVAYAIGVAEPVSVLVDSQRTGTVGDEILSKLVREHFDLTPFGLIEMLKLRAPIYSSTSSHGHFGREPGEGGKGTFTWEKTDIASALKKGAGKAVSSPKKGVASAGGKRRSPELANA